MERLTGLDASFLYLETPTTHMHVAMTMIFDPSTMPGGYSFEQVKEFIGAALHLVPPFRRRLVEVPFRLHHPLWVEDPDFDLDYHIRRIGGARPGRPSRAGRAGRPDRQHAARPQPSAVGAVGRRGPERRQRRRGHQGPPLRDRRRLRRRADGPPLRPRAGAGASRPGAEREPERDPDRPRAARLRRRSRVRGASSASSRSSAPRSQSVGRVVPGTPRPRSASVGAVPLTAPPHAVERAPSARTAQVGLHPRVASTT